jgi:hypothetical protein
MYLLGLVGESSRPTRRTIVTAAKARQPLNFTLGIFKSTFSMRGVNWMRKIFLCALVALLCTSFSLPAIAVDEEVIGARIRQLYAAGDKPGAVKEIRKAAEMGLAWAQTSLAVAYLQGNGIEKSNTEAINWFEKAADQNYAPAQYHLAGLYAQGLAGERKEKLASELMRKSAEQGYEKAILTLKIWNSTDSK